MKTELMEAQLMKTELMKTELMEVELMELGMEAGVRTMLRVRLPCSLKVPFPHPQQRKQFGVWV
jgi:hypothetical protein